MKYSRGYNLLNLPLGEASDAYLPSYETEVTDPKAITAEIAAAKPPHKLAKYLGAAGLVCFGYLIGLASTSNHNEGQTVPAEAVSLLVARDQELTNTNQTLTWVDNDLTEQLYAVSAQDKVAERLATHQNISWFKGRVEIGQGVTKHVIHNPIVLNQRDVSPYWNQAASGSTENPILPDNKMYQLSAVVYTSRHNDLTATFSDVETIDEKHEKPFTFYDEQGTVVPIPDILLPQEDSPFMRNVVTENQVSTEHVDGGYIFWSSGQGMQISYHSLQ